MDTNERQTMTLTDFLLARIAEDEAGFAVSDADRADPERWGGDLNAGYIVGLHLRLLAECDAKRRIVEEHSHDGTKCRDCGQWDEACRTKRLLAVPYADHPDYDESWRP